MLNSSDIGQTNDSNIPLLQPMGFGEILDTIFSLYRRRFLLFLSIIAIYFFGGKVEGAKADMDTIRGMVMYVSIDTDTLFYTLTAWSDRIVSALVFPIWVIGLTLLYLNLQIRKEGADIQSLATTSA